jgi:hypothetical protein
MCVGVFHPPVRNSEKLLSIWRKVKREALLMDRKAGSYTQPLIQQIVHAAFDPLGGEAAFSLR